MNRPIIWGTIVFIILLSVTGTVGYQRYIIFEEAKTNELTDVAGKTKEKIESVLKEANVAAGTLAYIVKKYGIEGDFDEIGKEILETHPSIDAIELVNGGVITHVYPLQGNASAIGYDILKDSLKTRQEAVKTIERREMYFAGPLYLKQGGIGIVGRLPIFVNDEFCGFSAVLIRFDTLINAAGMDNLHNTDYVFQLAKLNPATGREEFFLATPPSRTKKFPVFVEVPAGSWKIYVRFSKPQSLYPLLPFAILSLLLSCLGGIFTWYVTKQPHELRKLVQEKTKLLKKRVNELRCLYRLSELANNREHSIEQILGECVKIIPPAYQHAEAAHAKIVFGGRNFESENFVETAWRQQAFLKVNDDIVGTLIVCYDAEMPGAQEGPFLTEERHLITSIAGMLGNAIERKLAESEIVKLGRLYKFTSAINEMILKAEDRETIYFEACRIAIEHGNFRMAWVGINNKEEKQVIPFTFAGHEDGYLKKIKISTGEDEYGQGPTGRAIRGKQYTYCNDIANDRRMLPWRNEALKRGYRSSITAPVVVGSQVIAVYTIYSADPFFFNDAEIKLLIEVAGNIAYAVDKIQIREMQKQSEIELRESEEKFRNLTEEALVGVFIVQDERFIYVNPRFEEISGYDKEKLIDAMSFADLVHEDDAERVWNIYLSNMTGDNPSHHHSLRAVKKDGGLLYIDLAVSTISYKGKRAVIGTIFDITAQVEEEKRLNRAVTRAQEKERSEISMELHDNVKQILAASLVNLDFVKGNLSDYQVSAELIGKVQGYIRDAMTELRGISHRLAPAIDSALPLQEQIETLIDGMNVSQKIEVSFCFDNFREPVNSDVELAIYRILQEQFTNILKHANASSVHVNIESHDGGLIVSIEDNGRGFDTATRKDGIGLENIKRRVQVLDGQVRIISSPGNGCNLIVQVPVAGEVVN